MCRGSALSCSKLLHLETDTTRDEIAYALVSAI